MDNNKRGKEGQRGGQLVALVTSPFFGDGRGMDG